MPAALALEWIHTASLLQDDLPCMDDDAVRRRQVTAHRAYGEGPALLASDALLVMAFQDLLGLARHSTVGYERAVRMCMETCDVVGLAGLVDGQARDLTLRSEPRVSLQRILDVHRRKTAPLFGLAASLGGILCNMSQHETDELRTTLLSMGLAFQIVDDVLDATGAETFGRGPGSDRRNRLPTFGSVMNAAEGRRTARGLLEPILQAPKSSFLAPELLRLASFVLDRER
jgi:geranylgeranyl pyrophosphate synthase